MSRVYKSIPSGDRGRGLVVVAKTVPEPEMLMTESGLKDYLVLLSIQQTCRYSGISFLRFLLSGEKDIDQYCARLYKKRRPFGG